MTHPPIFDGFKMEGRSPRTVKNDLIMKACRLLCFWCLALILVPCFTFGQIDIRPTAFTYNDQGTTISSNVPLNEINIHAWRNFHRIFRKVAGDENWFYSDQGYRVAFLRRGYHYEAYFDDRGGYRYSLHHYAGKDIPREPGDILKRKYPDYHLNVVTEITDGEKIVYLVRLVSTTTIKTISLCDGDIQLIGEEHIGSGTETASITSRQSYP